MKLLLTSAGIWGGDPLFLADWMRRSGLTGLLPTLRPEAVYVGVSAGSIAATSAFVETYDEPPRGDDRPPKAVDMVFRPLLCVGRRESWSQDTERERRFLRQRTQSTMTPPSQARRTHRITSPPSRTSTWSKTSRSTAVARLRVTRAVRDSRHADVRPRWPADTRHARRTGSASHARRARDAPPRRAPSAAVCADTARHAHGASRCR